MKEAVEKQDGSLSYTVLAGKIVAVMCVLRGKDILFLKFSAGESADGSCCGVAAASDGSVSLWP